MYQTVALARRLPWVRPVTEPNLIVDVPKPGSGTVPAIGPDTLLIQLLSEQRQLTAVEQFSHAHDHAQLQTTVYRQLMPLTAPPPGAQYAFEVDLDKCSGCKACVTACHSLNGLDDGEVWRDVGMLVSDDWRRPLQKIVTTACHHCVDPGCLNGCPVLAYEKDEGTGIVRHLDDQCIGCQYCILKCPYDVPKYSGRRGIVRKCDMCQQRLAGGEAPACAQACPSEAIRITTVAYAEITAAYRDSPDPAPFLPAAPESAVTLPSTRYISKQPLPPDLIPSNAADVRLQPGHWPLVLMLVLTQFGIGTILFMSLLPRAARPVVCIVGLAVAMVGLLASLSHLGRPLKAWRSFLNVRRSWLSREIVAMGLFAFCATGLALLLWTERAMISGIAGAATMFSGISAVYCSAMVYEDTPRPLWNGGRSLARFFGTAAVLGLAACWCVGHASECNCAPYLAAGLVVVTLAKLAIEHRVFRCADTDLADEIWPKGGDFAAWSVARSAVLLRDELGFVTRWRFLCGSIGGVLLPCLTLLSIVGPAVPALAGLTLCVIGEVIERYTFFLAVVPPRMPGA